MLAYVFWHWRTTHAEQSTYQESLISFHKALREQQPAGFQYSIVFRLERAPWLGRDKDTYEEWYLVESFAALGVLNEAAVSGLCKEPHHQVAKDAAGGAGGIYRLWLGEPGLATAQVALWFAKPDGMSYEQLRAQPEIASAAGSIWQRQMTLGPTAEFCWHSPHGHSLPKVFEQVTRVNISRLF